MQCIRWADETRKYRAYHSAPVTRFRLSDPSKKFSSGDLHPILASNLQVEKSKIDKTCSPFALLEIFNAKKYERNPFEQPNSLEQLQTGAYLLWHWEKDIGIMDKTSVRPDTQNELVGHR